MTLWLLMKSVKVGHEVHSVHANEDVCKEWARCLEHNGDYTSIALMKEDAIEQVVRYTEAGKE